MHQSRACRIRFAEYGFFIGHGFDLLLQSSEQEPANYGSDSIDQCRPNGGVQ
jgi:hypothetical protein